MGEQPRPRGVGEHARERGPDGAAGLRREGGVLITSDTKPSM
jgi:hypothetical protein